MDIFEKIRFHYPEYIYIFALSGLGDICYCLSVIKGIKEKIGKKVLVITQKYSERLIDCFADVDDCVVLNDAQAREIISRFCLGCFQIAFGSERGKNMIFSCDPLTYSEYLEYLPGMNYLDYLKTLYLNENVEFSYPVVKPQNRALGFNNIHRTVVINPYSNTLDTSHYNVFERIAQVLISKNYEVYTNIVSDQKPLDGTLPLRCSIEDFYYVSGSVAAIISIRSGILDFSIGSGGNFVVLYDNTWNRDFMKAYSLVGWKTGSRVYELYFDDDKGIFKALDNILK